MLTLTGKYNTAVIYTDIIEQTAISQIINLCNQKFTENSQIRMMPDVHAGKGCVIGTTMTITDKIVPNLVGADIGCGMEVVRVNHKNIDFDGLDKFIRKEIPSGNSVRQKIHPYVASNELYPDLTALKCKDSVNLERAALSIGTLGGGNHFIEVDEGEDGYYIVIHSGSRHLGIEVASYYQKKASEQLMTSWSEDTADIIKALKSQGKESDIQPALAKIKEKYSVATGLEYLTGALFEDYIHDMSIVQQFADCNRKAMMSVIILGMHLDMGVIERFTTIHNYIDTKNMILRKGSVSAQYGERLIIPINMRDGSLICTGKGNPEWNYSAPHGAGRLMSRSEAKASFTVDEFTEAMTGIYTTSVNSSTIDECPMAYKNIDDIINNIGDTVTVDEIIKPVYNFKASS